MTAEVAEVKKTLSDGPDWTFDMLAQYENEIDRIIEEVVNEFVPAFQFLFPAGFLFDLRVKEKILELAEKLAGALLQGALQFMGKHLLLDGHNAIRLQDLN